VGQYPPITVIGRRPHIQLPHNTNYIVACQLSPPLRHLSIRNRPKDREVNVFRSSASPSSRSTPHSPPVLAIKLPPTKDKIQAERIITKRATTTHTDKLSSTPEAMAPKKKSNKKGQDDWESELGEAVDPIAQAEERAKEEEAAGEEESIGGGGLLAALKKNRGKKVKKGKIAADDELLGEDPPIDGASADVQTDLAAKAPQEATFDDEDDIFSGPVKKGKGGKGGKQPEKTEEPNDDDGEERDASGRIMTKKEKEKAKKEREKQRKKEQASLP
jgi:hypothetical protein